MKIEKIIKPYIGITGFVTREEVDELIKYMPKNSNRLLMVGVLVNWDSLLGFGNNRHPNIKYIKEIFVDDPSVLNIIHYHTNELETLFEQLTFLKEMGGKNIHGFQLNNAWPPLNEISKFKHAYPEQIIVLVITSQAFDDINYRSNLLVSRISEYKGLVDYVLLDQSEGEGILLNPEFMRTYIEVLKRKELGMNICIAGG